MDTVPEFLDESDARSIIRLLGEVADLSGELPAKRRWLANGLCRIIHASIWIWSAWQGGLDAQERVPLWFIDDGWLSEQQRALGLMSFVTKDGDALAARVAVKDQRHWTRIRRDACSDEEWRQCDFLVKHRAPAQLDDFLLSNWDLGGGSGCALGFQRLTGEPFFTDRERALVHLVTHEVQDLFVTGNDPKASQLVWGLSERRRQVLMFLLCGTGPEQIAGHLGLSTHTVRDHVKSLYRHFQVSSRGELMSIFIRGGSAAQR